MGESEIDRQVEINKRAYAGLRERIRREYAGKFVGMASGRIVASGLDFDQVVATIEAFDPKPVYYHVFGAEEEPIFEVVDSISSEFLPE